MNKDIFVISTNEEFKVFADPLRLKIIDTYVDLDKPLTVKMVADELKEIPAKIHYHIQKLIKIGVLELDHIEVINGINAKYYLLKYTSFRFDIKDDTSSKMKSFQIDTTVNLLLKNVDNFRDDIIKIGEAAKNKDKKDEMDFFLSQRYIYLNPEDLIEFRSFITEFFDKHSKLDESKTKCSVISGVFKKED